MWEMASEGEIQEKRTSLNIRSTKATETAEREIADSLGHLDGMTEDEVRIIYYSATPYIDALTHSNGNIQIKGYVNLRVVVESENNAAFTMQKKLPFDVEISTLEEIDEDTYVIPECRVVSERFSVNPDETGVDILGNVIVEYTANIEKNITEELTCDAFITVCPTENTYCDFSYNELIGRVQHSAKHIAEAQRNELCEGSPREVVFVNATPKIESVSSDGKRIEIKGEIKYTGVTSELNDDGSISYSGIKFSSPFVEYVNESCHNSENTRYKVKIIAEEPVAELDADKVYLSCGLRFDVLVSEDKSVRYVAECMGRESERYMKEKATVRVYYPDENEDAFSVARKFHIAVSKLCADNNLSSEASTFERTDLPKKLIIN
jgi:hypothetical protein